MPAGCRHIEWPEKLTEEGNVLKTLHGVCNSMITNLQPLQNMLSAESLSHDFPECSSKPASAASWHSELMNDTWKFNHPFIYNMRP
jgi:hypothetical protein